MSISVSHSGSIRYIYYRCRSSAGGRPPCVGTNVRVNDLENFLCEVLADVHDQASEIPIEQRRRWSDQSEAQQRRSLPLVIEEVVFDSELGEVTVDLKDEYADIALANTDNNLGAITRGG